MMPQTADGAQNPMMAMLQQMMQAQAAAAGGGGQGGGGKPAGPPKVDDKGNPVEQPVNPMAMMFPGMMGSQSMDR